MCGGGGGQDPGEPFAEEPVTELGELTGCPETRTNTPSVDDPGGRPTPGLRVKVGIIGRSPNTTNCCCCCLCFLGGVIMHSNSRSKLKDEDPDEGVNNLLAIQLSSC